MSLNEDNPKSDGHEPEPQADNVDSPPQNTLLPCPFCGDGHITVSEYDTKDAWWTQCDNIHCGAEGPTRKTEQAAQEAWNHRAVTFLVSSAVARLQNELAITAEKDSQLARDIKLVCNSVAASVVVGVEEKEGLELPGGELPAEHVLQMEREWTYKDSGMTVEDCPILKIFQGTYEIASVVGFSNADSLCREQNILSRSNRERGLTLGAIQETLAKHGEMSFASFVNTIATHLEGATRFAKYEALAPVTSVSSPEEQQFNCEPKATQTDTPFSSPEPICPVCNGDRIINGRGGSRPCSRCSPYGSPSPVSSVERDTQKDSLAMKLFNEDD